MSACMATRELLWLKQLLDELQVSTNKPLDIYIDNQSAIQAIKNAQISTRSKHIDVQYLFIREAQRNKQINAKYIESKKQKADLLTKPLTKAKFGELRSSLNVTNYNEKKIFTTSLKDSGHNGADYDHEDVCKDSRRIQSTRNNGILSKSLW